MKPTTAGERLRQARQKARLSAEELGRRAGLFLGRDRPISQSAVRNQENGTNGIPVVVAEAYSEVLGVTPEWILWGTTPEDFDFNTAARQEVAEDAPSTMPSAKELQNRLAIPIVGLVSSRWLPHTVNSRVPDDEQHIWLSLGDWDAERDRLRAYEVVDSSLEPVIKRKSFVVVADSEITSVHEGSYVIAGRWLGGELHYAVRQVRTGPLGIDLFSIDNGETERLPLVRDGGAADDYFVEWVVLAVVWDPTPKAPRLQIPPAPHMAADAGEGELDESAAARRSTREALRAHFGGEGTDESYEGPPLDDRETDGG